MTEAVTAEERAEQIIEESGGTTYLCTDCGKMRSFNFNANAVLLGEIHEAKTGHAVVVF